MKLAVAMRPVKVCPAGSLHWLLSFCEWSLRVNDGCCGDPAGRVRAGTFHYSAELIYITIDKAMVKSSAVTEMMVSQTDQVFMV